jgi:hypothetical protein
MSKQEITGNRDASYSNWQRNQFCRGYGVWDDDMYDPLHVYRVSYGYDEEGLTKIPFKFETKGLLVKDGKILLPDANNHIKQFDAIRADAKRYDRFGNRADLGAYCVWYLIEDDIKFFLVVALNDVCLAKLGQRIKGFCEADYIKFFLSFMDIDLSNYSKYNYRGRDQVKYMFDEEQRVKFVSSIKQYFKEL